MRFAFTPSHYRICFIAFVFASLKFSGCVKGESPAVGASAEKRAAKVLVFSLPEEKPASDPVALVELFRRAGYETVALTNVAALSATDLNTIDALVLVNVSAMVVPPATKAAIQRYVESGGGILGIQDALLVENDWAWYHDLLGAYVASSPVNPVQREARIAGADEWRREESWYNFRQLFPKIEVVQTLDENSLPTGSMGAAHPISWRNQYDGGRSLYTALSFQRSDLADERVCRQIENGIAYVVGSGVRDSSKAYAVEVPEPERFRKTILIDHLNEPMMLAISKAGTIYFTERATGRLQSYDTKTGVTSLVYKFDLATDGGTGLTGIALDPNFDQNRLLYLYYTPPTTAEDLLFRLSRFTLTESGHIDPSSEKVLLTVPVQRNGGGHHGTDLEWDKFGNLYLSTGDSSSPAPSDGYAPLDERPGHSAQDSQRSAANTHDLKGKILRIHPQADGSYSIPDGNLFPAGMPKTRAEIYIMGVRNPYRMALNPKSAILYWGEPGPDAGTDSDRGPMGYDEFNQARKAGNYGWPYFVADNEAYSKWDFATSKAGPRFDVKAPKNESVNNTGLVDLPPPQPAMIWYPYSASPQFPELGVGGRCAFAGAFYSFDPGTSPTRLPSYFDGGLFVFDWMRNWIRILRFDKNENYVRSEAFMPTTGDFRRPMAMKFGADGAMYLLEYGSVYGVNNPDARLVKVDYLAGEIAPIAVAGIGALHATNEAVLHNDRVHLSSELIGPLPKLNSEVTVSPGESVHFIGTRSHLVGSGRGRLGFVWKLGAQTLAEEPNFVHAFDQPGDYLVDLMVKSETGLSNSAQVKVHVAVGQVHLQVASADNESFFWPNSEFSYQLHQRSGMAPAENTRVHFGFFAEPPTESQLAAAAAPSNAGSEAFMDSGLIRASDCRACHTVNTHVVGPSFKEVALRYKDRPDAMEVLTKKVINGGAGNWGNIPMAAHPQLPPEDVKTLVAEILQLGGASPAAVDLPLQGSISFKDHPDSPLGQFVLWATNPDSTDEDGLKADVVLRFRSATLPAALADEHFGAERYRNNLGPGGDRSYLRFSDLDLSGVTGIRVRYSSLKAKGRLALRRDSFAGETIAVGAFGATGSWSSFQEERLAFNSAQAGRHDLFLVTLADDSRNSKVIEYSTIEFNR